MRSIKTLALAAVVAACSVFAVSARAQERRDCSVVTRANVARCAVTASLAAKAEEQTLDSFAGRRRAANVFLPSNPVFSVTGARDIEPTVTSADREPLWSATLSQELEIGGQRGRRLDVVAAERSAQVARVAGSRRSAAADALLTYFDVLAANEEARLADRLARLAGALTAVARARAEAGVAAGVDAQLADAAAARLLQGQLGARSRVATTSAALATVLGLDPTQATLRVEGELTPIELAGAGGPSFVEASLERRTELQVARAESLARQHRIELFERSRIPNPTVSVFVRNDWINERLVGIGLQFPIPLPSPVGRTYAGEIAEASSLAARAATDAERVRRAVRLEIATALQAVALRKKQAELFDAARVRATEDTLQSIAEEIEARRLPVRDALLTQQSLIDYLFAHVEARRQLCFASVELARVAGIELEGGAR